MVDAMRGRASSDNGLWDSVAVGVRESLQRRGVEPTIGRPETRDGGVAAGAVSSPAGVGAALTLLVLPNGGVFVTLEGNAEPLAQGTTDDLDDVIDAIANVAMNGVFWVGHPIRRAGINTYAIAPDRDSCARIAVEGFAQHVEPWPAPPNRSPRRA